jgi:hypothetical protein
MTEYHQYRKDNPNTFAALGHARNAARAGQSYMAQYWIDRANSFGQLSARQVANVQKLLDDAIGKHTNR